jgi:hypothetical protein
MHRTPRSFATLAIVLLLAAVLAACGGAPAGPTPPDDDEGPVGDDPSPYWEMLVTGDDVPAFTVEGGAVASPSANTIELTASVPGGWSVAFVHDGGLPVGIPYATDNDDLLSATVTGPAGASCVVTPATGGGSFALLTLGEPEVGVPTGIASVVLLAPCAGFAEGVSFLIGFGVQ